MDREVEREFFDDCRRKFRFSESFYVYNTQFASLLYCRTWMVGKRDDRELEAIKKSSPDEGHWAGSCLTTAVIGRIRVNDMTRCGS